jgi:hypothetical protein
VSDRHSMLDARPTRDWWGWARRAVRALRKVSWSGLGSLALIVGLVVLATQGEWLPLAIFGALVVIGGVVGLVGGLRSGPRPPVPSRLVPLGRSVSVEVPDWVTDAKELGPSRPGRSQAVEPLLLPRWTPGILTLTLALEADDGPLDIDRVVESLARREAPARLPRRAHRSLSAGAHLLVDLSESMLPFRADLVALVARVRRVLGDDGLSVLRFAESPLAGTGPGRRSTWSRYEPPPTPRPVLVATDLGLTPEPDLDADLGVMDARADWIELAQLVRRAGCPLIVLVPYPRSRVPRELKRAMTVVEWDRTTTAAGVARVVRGG